ncbi:hypothetical protein EV562_113243 [Streptomyces sp. BK208]|nr:hypothetical protein EV562_113243 [Streptomyces sp. BK208]
MYLAREYLFEGQAAGVAGAIALIVLIGVIVWKKLG